MTRAPLTQQEEDALRSALGEALHHTETTPREQLNLPYLKGLMENALKVLR